MDEQLFIQTINNKAEELNINPLLLMSGIESLYTFKNVQLNAINFEFLDSLILTIFALRIGDQFHAIAEQNLASTDVALKQSATNELKELNEEEINASSNQFLKSFVSLINGKSVIRKYHEKALDVAAIEIGRTQGRFGESSIGNIILLICKNELNQTINLAALFGS